MIRKWKNDRHLSGIRACQKDPFIFLYSGMLSVTNHVLVRCDFAVVSESTILLNSRNTTHMTRQMMSPGLFCVDPCNSVSVMAKAAMIILKRPILKEKAMNYHSWCTLWEGVLSLGNIRVAFQVLVHSYSINERIDERLYALLPNQDISWYQIMMI